MFRLVLLTSAQGKHAHPIRAVLSGTGTLSIRNAAVRPSRRCLHHASAPLLAAAATLDPEQQGPNVTSAKDQTISAPSTSSSTQVGHQTQNDLGSQSGSDATANIREQIIAEILSRDKEIFELKRQHELSMLRVEQHQRRILKDQEDRGMYYEQNCNVHTFDTVSVGLHSQRTTLYHTLSLERLRNFKIILSIVTTFACCWYIYYRYMINPEFTYVEKPMKVLGSRVQAIREMQWDRLSDEEKMQFLQDKSRH